MAKLRAWLQAARPLAFGNIGLPIVFGATLAAFAGQQPLNAGGLLWALLWGAIDQLFIVFANDLADEELDAGQDGGTLVSGGSRVLVEGKLSRRELARAALAAALSLFALSIAASWALQTWLLPSCAALAVGMVWAYSFRPLRRSYLNGGAGLQAVGMGVVLPLVGWQLQGAGLGELLGRDIGGWPGLTWLLPGMLLAWCGNWLTAMPDCQGDSAGGKSTRPVRLGTARVALESSLLTFAAAVAVGTLLGLGPRGLALVSLLVGASLVFAHSRRKPDAPLTFVITSLAVTSALWLAMIGTLLARLP
jgi:1,4-dihydroxy-2-naphthoate octaprenyltransferase